MPQNKPTSADPPLVKPALEPLPESQISTRSQADGLEPTVAGKPLTSRASEAAFTKALDPTVGVTNATVLKESAPKTLGPYEILQKLGEGGMGAVYKARHTRLDKLVALKVLPAHLTRDVDALARFNREMKVVGKLEHPGIVRAMDAGDANGTHYLAMELVEGQDAAQYVAKRGPLPINTACRLIRQAAIALSYAHERGMVHRDIKPSNLFIAKSGQVKVLDLGLARLALDEQHTALTSNGQCMGTPDYMSPEQWEDVHSVDHRCDLYALGCTLFHLLVGRPPYGDDQHNSIASKMKAHLLKPIPDVRALRPDIPEELAAIYTKLMAKDLADRLENAKLLADQLVPFCIADVQGSPSTNTPAQTFGAKGQVGSGNVAITVPLFPKTSGDQAVPSPASAQFSQQPSVSINIKSTAAVQSPPRRRSRTAVAAAGAAALLLLGVIIITITNKDGTKTRSEVPSSSKIEISTDDQAPLATSLSPLASSPWHGWPAEAPPPAIAPFNAEQAQQHQEAWAKYLGVPVEYTNSLGMKFRLIPPGEFTMGSSPEEIAQAFGSAGDDRLWKETINSEGPQHKVTLTKATYISVHEVTQGQFEHVTGSNPSRFGPMGASKEAVVDLDTTSFPVEKVSWDESNQFCMKLSKVQGLTDGKAYRLPTDAEWEFACRAGTTTEYWIGKNDQDRLQTAWLYTNSSERTHAVGELKENPFGLYDVHGNVWEWVQDAWDPTFYSQFQGQLAVDPINPSVAGAPHVTRGGCWNSSITSSRSATRCPETAAYSNTLIGFRVSLTAEAVREILNLTGNFERTQ